MTKPCTIYNTQDPDQDWFPGDYDWSALVDETDKLFKQANIRPSFREEPMLACITDSGDVLGAVYFGRSNTVFTEQGDPLTTYTFSVVVSPAGRRRGIARSLVRRMVKEAEDLAFDSYVSLEAEVVNPHMAKLLKSEGFQGEWTPRERYMNKLLD